MEKFLYLSLMFFTISFTVPYSWNKRMYFFGKWKFVFPSIFLTALFFIPWDIFFTHKGVWGFNPKYITGIKFLLLPAEEWLFFIFVPFSCIFIHEALKYFFKPIFPKPYYRVITYLLIGFSAFICFFYYKFDYSFSTFGLLLIFLCFHLFILKSKYLGQFYFTYLFVLIPFFLINSILTGSWIDEEVVWYNNFENMGIRIGTVPFEDLFYNMLMLFLALTIYEELKIKSFTTNA